jgi:DNA-binding transcriptional LysR family regulator
VDFRQLEAFIYTVEFKSFSGAAKKLYLSQPTISAHIHALEKELNTKLIQRTTKKFSVTKEGESLYEYALTILDLRKKAVSELSNESTKAVHIGASTTPSTYLLPNLLSSFKAVTPEVTFHLHCSDSIDIIDKVANGTLDLGFVGTKLKDYPCEYLPFATDELVIVTPNTKYFQKLKKQKIPLEQLLLEPMIIHQNTSGTKIEFDQFLKNVGMDYSSLNIIAHMNQPEVIKSCIIKGMGIAIFSEKIVKTAKDQGFVLTFSMGEHKLVRDLYIVHSQNRLFPKQVIAFMDFIHSWLNN